MTEKLITSGLFSGLAAKDELRGRFKTRQANPYSKRTGSRVMLNYACAL